MSNRGRNSGKINMKGREYKTVALRVAEFRLAHPIADGWCIATEPVEISADRVLFRAAIVDPAGVQVATGYAEELRSARGVNSTSAVENAETSAIGRALAAAGWGGEDLDLPEPAVRAVGAEVVKRREDTAEVLADLRSFAAAVEALAGLTVEEVAGYCESVGWPRPATVSPAERLKLVEMLQTGLADKVRSWSAAQRREVTA